MKVLHHLRTAYGRLGPTMLSASLSDIDAFLGTSYSGQYTTRLPLYILIYRNLLHQLKIKLSSIEDRGQTDHVTILANLFLTLDLEFQSPASYDITLQNRNSDRARCNVGKMVVNRMYR